MTQNKSFVFETTGAGKNYIKHLREAKVIGYSIHILFLWLGCPELALKRVAERVKQGGHNIPKDVVVSRYISGLKNFSITILSLRTQF